MQAGAWALSLAVVMSLAGAARADDVDPPDFVKPFLTGNEANMQTITGTFGPDKATTLVVYYPMAGEGFRGFALIPDARAPHGQRKLRLPTLPAISLVDTFEVALIANLDKDPADEVVLGFRVTKSRSTDEFYNTTEYVVLDWNGHDFVRLARRELQLARKMASRAEDKTSSLSEDDVRAALGVEKR